MSGKIIRRTLIALLLILVIGAFISGSEIYAYSFRMSERSSDAAIVLGAAVWGSELFRTPSSERRLWSRVCLLKIFLLKPNRTGCLNLLEAKEIISWEEFEQVLIVSDPLHMRRSIWLAENIGLNAETSPTQTSRYQSYGTKASFLIREI